PGQQPPLPTRRSSDLEARNRAVCAPWRKGAVEIGEQLFQRRAQLPGRRPGRQRDAPARSERAALDVDQRRRTTGNGRHGGKASSDRKSTRLNSSHVKI